SRPRPAVNDRCGRRRTAPSTAERAARALRWGLRPGALSAGRGCRIVAPEEEESDHGRYRAATPARGLQPVGEREDPERERRADRRLQEYEGRAVPDAARPAHHPSRQPRDAPPRGDGRAARAHRTLARRHGLPLLLPAALTVTMGGTHDITRLALHRHRA